MVLVRQCRLTFRVKWLAALSGLKLRLHSCSNYSALHRVGVAKLVFVHALCTANNFRGCLNSQVLIAVQTSVYLWLATSGRRVPVIVLYIGMVMPGTSLKSFRSHDCLVIDLYGICRLDRLYPDESWQPWSDIFGGQADNLIPEPKRDLGSMEDPTSEISTRVRKCPASLGFRLPW